jgi:hypothetical protein
LKAFDKGANCKSTAMKSLLFLSVLFSLFVFNSCDSQNTSKQTYGQAPENDSLNDSVEFREAQTPSAKARIVSAKRTKIREEIVMHPVLNPKTGAVSSYLPLPSKWKINSNATGNQPYLSGPGGIKASQYQGAQSIYVDDPYTRQAYQQAGQAMQAPVGLNYVVQNELTAIAQNLG